MKSVTAKKRVLVVDDSVFARRIVTDTLSKSPDLEVVGAATNGQEALLLIQRLRPDVVTLDIEMPGINGLETLRRIMAERPTPVVMLSSLTVSGATESIQALKLGAVDIMAKPHGSHALGLSNAQISELIGKVLAAASVSAAKLPPTLMKHVPHRPTARPSSVVSPTHFPIVLIASSTGGPRALRTIVPYLPTDNGAAYVVVQHLPEGFSGPLVKDLNAMTELNAYESANDQTISPGDLIFARAGYHTVFGSNGVVKVTSDPPLWGVRPSADVTMASMVPVFRSRLIGVVLTGMGRDGANGTVLIKETGGITISEHESTCVDGMPKSAFETGAVDVVAPLDQIPDAISDALAKAVTKHTRRPAA
jgi:two-component system chemotaxis response regulator CheB